MANKKLNAVITIGGAVSSSLIGSLGTAKGKILQVGTALKSLENQQRLTAQSIRTFGEMGKNVDGLRAKYVAITAQVDKLRVAHERMAKIAAAKQENLSKRADYRGQLVDAVAIGATAAAPIVAAAKFETAMLGVAKQVEGARDANGKLTQVYYDMGSAIQKMGREIPLATNDLADMVAAGARMGVAKDELLGFTRTAAMMADAFELPAAELADNMGKIAGLFKIPIPAIGDLADAVNYLDDNAISKGSDIIDFLTRTGGAASAVKIGAKDMAALGSTLLTLGERSETASTATSAMFAKFAAADKGTKKFKSAMAEIGLSVSEVQNGMQKDAGATILKVMDAINKLPKENQLGVMVELIGLEHADTMAKLANNTGEFRKQLEMANSAAAKGSMSREFAARLQTTNAQFQLMKNRAEEVAVNFGTVLLPAVNDVFGVIGKISSALSDFAKAHPQVTKVIVGTVVALGALKVGSIAAGYAMTFVKGGALQMAGALAGTRAQLLLTSIAAKGLGTSTLAARGGVVGMATGALPMLAGAIRAVGVALMTNPIGLIVGGIAAAGYLIYRNWDGVKAFLVGTFEGVKSGLQPLVQTFTAFRDSLTPLKPLFDMIGSALTSAWNWFTNLLQPVVFTQEELGKAGAAGKSFGEFLAAGINFVLTPLNLLITGLTWVSNNIGGIMDKAVAFKNTVGDGIGGAWQQTKSFFGVGDDAAAGPVPPTAATNLPAVPKMASERGASSSYEDKSQNVYQIIQQPGQDQKALAREVAAEQERQRQVRQRGAMHDGAVTQ
jgi:TP901 family phage tail tape measure protein